MAILRATTVQSIAPRIPEAFRLYKGGKAGTSKRGTFQGGDDYNSPYIRMEPDERFYQTPATIEGFDNMADQMLARWEVLMQGGRISIRFPFATIEENFPWGNTIFAAATGAPKGSGKCVGRCDGVTNTRWPEKRPHPTNKNQQITVAVDGVRPCQATEDGDCPIGCKLKATLKIMIPDLYPGGVGIFPIGSIIDVQNLLGQLEAYRGYDLRQLPFSLYRKKSMIDKPQKDGSTRQGENWGLNIELDPQMSQAIAQFESRKFLAEITQAEFVDTVPSLPPAEKPALSAAKPWLQNTEEGDHIKSQIQAAVSSDDGKMLTQIFEDAQKLLQSGEYDRGKSQAWLDLEEQRAREIMRQREVGVPPVATSNLGDRLGVVRAFTGHSDAQIKAIAKKAGTTARKAMQNDGDFAVMRSAMIVDWTIGVRPDLFETELQCQEEFGEWLAAEYDGEDPAESQLLADWQAALIDAIEQKAENDVNPPEEAIGDDF